jgi:recombination protein RecA
MFRGDDVGISREGDLIDLGVQHQIVDKSGTWFSYGGERLGQGKENARMFLRENPALAGQIEDEVRQLLSIPLSGGDDPGPDGGGSADKPSASETPAKDKKRQKAAA